ncbi:hypothetical protein BKA82DRAFT_4359465 [Pisolithus tinctorius]|nr:hypothetical protein BKA82DRAFT_4359465 [Pisolithus tinctorius]
MGLINPDHSVQLINNLTHRKVELQTSLELKIREHLLLYHQLTLDLCSILINLGMLLVENLIHLPNLIPKDKPESLIDLPPSVPQEWTQHQSRTPSPLTPLPPSPQVEQDLDMNMNPFKLTLAAQVKESPEHFKDVLKLSPELQKKWFDAMKDELKSIEERNVWTLVDPKLDHKPVKC